MRIVVLVDTEHNCEMSYVGGPTLAQTDFNLILQFNAHH